MKKYGNFLFNRRVVISLLLCLCALVVMIPCQIVKADISSSSTVTMQYGKIIKESVGITNFDCSATFIDCEGGYSFVIEEVYDSYAQYRFGYVTPTKLNSPKCHFVQTSDLDNYGFVDETKSLNLYTAKNGVYVYYYNTVLQSPNTKESGRLGSTKSDLFYLYKYSGSSYDGYEVLSKYVGEGTKSDGLIIGGSGYMPNTQAYSEIGCLDNVQMETYVTNKKELIDADENADLSKINQDKVIVYSSSTTSGIDLSKGGYRVQLYGSYAWQDKSGNIKSEDKGHKTFIKDWDAQDNIKGLDRSKYKWIDWKSANDKVEADKTDKAHKPNAFEKMTTYANYQYEPIWYLRIVSQDNKYGAWVKLYNSTNKGKYRSESVDDDDNAVPDSGGGYNKPKDTSEITGTGDTPEDAKNNVPKAEEKQDNDDLNDSANGNNSTFDKLEQFTKGIGDVPKMIADIFSFLPSWCLEVVAIGFALLMILIVVKFIRG